MRTKPWRIVESCLNPHTEGLGLRRCCLLSPLVQVADFALWKGSTTLCLFCKIDGATSRQQSWLQPHSVKTGPFTLTSSVPCELHLKGWQDDCLEARIRKLSHFRQSRSKKCALLQHFSSFQQHKEGERKEKRQSFAHLFPPPQTLMHLLVKVSLTAQTLFDLPVAGCRLLWETSWHTLVEKPRGRSKQLAGKRKEEIKTAEWPLDL